MPMPFDPSATITSLSFWVKVYALIGSIIAAIRSVPNWRRLWTTRNLRKVWGIKDGENVILICSELEDPDVRQNVEDREFIYNLKYGDVDAFFEVVVTLLRLYPKLKLRILSAGEAEKMQFDMSQTLILIGGPDYNTIVRQVLAENLTQFEYRSPNSSATSSEQPNEIVLFHKPSEKEHYSLNPQRDFGYFERIHNPNNAKRKKIILIGGCHTIGVTAAVKAFSLANSEYGVISETVLQNARVVARNIRSHSEFAVLVKAKKVGQSITTPVIESSAILSKNSVRRKMKDEEVAPKR